MVRGFHGCTLGDNNANPAFFPFFLVHVAWASVTTVATRVFCGELCGPGVASVYDSVRLSVDSADSADSADQAAAFQT